MSASSRFRRWAEPLCHTPLHPQWLALREHTAARRQVTQQSSGYVLDVGCGDRWAEGNVAESDYYVGLDYPDTVSKGYPGLPNVFGDAQCLPFLESSFDVVLMMDVLEHLPDPDQAIAEAYRILKPGGRLILQVPFLYPLHDEPHDFQRWTAHGLRQLCARHRLTIETEETHGHPCETAAVLLAIAAAKGAIDLISERSMLILLIPLLLLMIPVANIVGWLLGKILPDSGMMPISYRFTAVKPA